MEKIKILLADDHDILMDGIASILNEAPHLDVVGKAASVQLAKERVQQLLPDLVLTDISMGDASGLELAQFITRYFPLTRVMVLSMHDNVQHLSAMFDAGAMGYLLKNVRKDELLLAIERVMMGHRYIQQSIAGSYTRATEQQKEKRKQSRLSPREIEIIRLIAQELTTLEISRRLFLSEKTVETHRKNIGRKTGTKNIVGLLNYARDNGLI